MKGEKSREVFMLQLRQKKETRVLPTRTHLRLGPLVVLALIGCVCQSLSAAEGKSVSALIEQSQHGKVENRIIAISRLGSAKDSHAIPALMQLCEHDSDPKIRRYAINALGDLRATEALSLITRACFEEPDILAREAAISRLPKFGGAKTIPVLKKILNGPYDSQYPLGQLIAAASLGRLGDPSGYDVAVEALTVAAGEDGVLGWRKMGAAIRALKDIGDPKAIPHLQKVVEMEAHRRFYAAETAARLEFQKLESLDERIAYLSNALRNRFGDVRTMAAYKLVLMKEIRALQVVVDAARDKQHPGMGSADGVLNLYFKRGHYRSMMKTGKAVNPDLVRDRG